MNAGLRFEIFHVEVRYSVGDDQFGNRLYELRKTAELSQFQVARLVGVSDRAVSKWENGTARPRKDSLRKLAALFKVPENELVKLRDQAAGPKIRKIVITGGPSGGKTTALSWIQNAFSKLGYTVLVVPETATEFISGGVAPWTCGSNLDYQKCQMQLQLEKERLFEQAARTMKADKILIVCDRGAMDNRAYMNDEEFSRVLEEIGKTESELLNSYDAVFHLETAAKGAQRFYTTENNKARTETPEQAIEVDNKLIEAWTGHPHLRIIDNSTDFYEKLKRLIAEMRLFLGEPAPYKIKRKFLIEYPDTQILESLPNCRKVEIFQTYLQSKNGDELRIRERIDNGNPVYYKTQRHYLSGMKRIELEENLSRGEYLQLMKDSDPSMHPIHKTRYCLTHENQYFEIDVFPFWTDKAIAEIELNDESEEIRFPEQMRIFKEVTDDENYKNASLARTGGELPETEIADLGFLTGKEKCSVKQ